MNARRESPGRLQRPGFLRRWAAAHSRACFDSLGRLWRQPLGSLLSALVIGLTLALPAALHTLVVNLGGASEQWEHSRAVTVMLKTETGDDRGRALADELAGGADVQAVRFIGRDEALAEFRAHSGLGDALALLPDNPLPAVLVVVPEAAATADGVRALAQRLAALPEADEALLDDAWLNRLHALLEVLSTTVLLFSIALGAAVLVIVGNTIRLDVAARREEIEVMKLVGAPDGFIRRPFLYAGLWYGLIGALLALVLVGVGLLVVEPAVQRLAASYDSDFALRGAGGRATGLVLVGGCVLGWVGARLAVLRQLRAIEPS